MRLLSSLCSLSYWDECEGAYFSLTQVFFYTSDHFSIVTVPDLYKCPAYVWKFLLSSWCHFTQVLICRIAEQKAQNKQRGCSFGARRTCLWVRKHEIFFCSFPLNWTAVLLVSASRQLSSEDAQLMFLFLLSDFRWKTVQVHVGGLRLAICALRRIDAPLQEAHRG